mgnify:FL=1
MTCLGDKDEGRSEAKVAEKDGFSSETCASALAAAGETVADSESASMSLKKSNAALMRFAQSCRKLGQSRPRSRVLRDAPALLR